MEKAKLNVVVTDADVITTSGGFTCDTHVDHFVVSGTPGSTSIAGITYSYIGGNWIDVGVNAQLKSQFADASDYESAQVGDVFYFDQGNTTWYKHPHELV